MTDGMRTALRSKGNKTQVSRVYPNPAPVGGWNARDSVAEMKATDALVLDEWFPSTSDVRIRKGCTSWATGMTTAVETIMAYLPQNTTNNKLFAAVPTKIYDVSSTGAVGAAVVSSLTNGRWQYVNMTTSGGHFLMAVNGADKLQNYDGSTWTAVDGASTYAITGVTTTTLIGINTYKSRVFMIPVNSTKFWYLPVDSIGGAALSYELGGIFKKGGYLVAMGTVSVQSYSGFSDYAVFLSSVGEVAVYGGTDPSSAANWSLVGLFTLGTPIGRRCMLKLGGDILIVTNNGVVPLSSALPTFGIQPDAAITDKIRDAMSSAASLYSANFGWSIHFFPAASFIVLNVPTKEGSEQQQYVMNTITKSWCRFKGWAANCFEIYNDQLFFGGLGTVYKAWNGTDDAGTAINAELIQAFSYFGANGSLKNFTMVQPVLSWDIPPNSLTVNFDTDFNIKTPQGQIALGGSAGSVWDTGLWDTAVWGGGTVTQSGWRSVNGLGYAGALHLMISSSLSTLKFAAYNTLFEPGGVL